MLDRRTLAKEEIIRLPHSERMEVMELLWESFAKEGIDYPSQVIPCPALSPHDNDAPVRKVVSSAMFLA